MKSLGCNKNCKSEEGKWQHRETVQQLIEIPRVISTSLLAMVKTLEEEIELGINPEKISTIRDKYSIISKREQEFSTVNVHPKTKVLTRSAKGFNWASECITNFKNDIDNDEDISNSLFSECPNIHTNFNNNITLLETKEKKDVELKGFKGWWRKKFRNVSEETNNCIIESACSEKYVDKKFLSIFQTSTKTSATKFCVFDGNQMPLTDLNGNVLKNTFDQPLLLFDSKGRPLDKDGGPVYDSRGIASNARGFSPHENHCITKLSPIALYDSKGYPLTGNDGHLLLNPFGEKLVKFSGSDLLLESDINGGGIWDKKGTPLCTVEGKWLDQEGKPYRFFLKNGLPVTDSLGRELSTINKKCLLERDIYGRPSQVQDTFGVSISAYAFDGTLRPPNEIENFCYFRGKPIRLYNSHGHPYTDEDGRVLFDSFGNPLVRVDFHHSPMKNEDGTLMFDERKIPLFCNPAKPMKSMEGKPLLLYDKNKRPLTDTRGVTLVYANGALLLKFDEIGRPYADQLGKPICDINGNEIFDAKFDATVKALVSPAQLQISYSGKPGLVVYDKAGRPLTDNEGNALVNSDGTSLEFNIIKLKRKVLKQEYDNYGRPLYDKYNRSLFCHGKPIFDIFGQKIIDIDLDETNPEYARSGNFNTYGIPVKDKYHRDLYDETGMPLCDKTGLPESKELHSCCGILLAVFDVEKKIKLPKEYAKILHGFSIELNGQLLGFPREKSVIPGDWILTCDISYINKSLEEDDYEYYSALIRISNLSELNALHEILVLYPNKNIKPC